MLWLLFLPVTIAFSLVVGLVGLIALPFAVVLAPIALLLWLPFALLRLTLKLIFLPFIVFFSLLGMVIGLVAFVGAIIIPLVPLAILVGAGWLFWKLAAGPVRSYPV